MISLNYLKSKKIWVLFKLEYNKRGELTKVPYSYKNKKVGCTDDYKNDWCDFETIVKYKEKIGADGIGFVIIKGMFFIDIDHKNKDDPKVKYIMSLTNTYAEYSNSGKGIHIYGTCNFDKLPIVFVNGKYQIDEKYYVKNSHNDIEIYVGGATSRFAVFTGKPINDVDLSDGTEAVNTLYKEFMLRSDFNDYENKNKKIEPTDFDNEKVNYYSTLNNVKIGGTKRLEPTEKNAERIIKALSKNEKFKKLFYEGDISMFNNDESSADMSLCNIIARMAGENFELIDLIFKKSKLYRDKWDRVDYKKITIEKAIKSQNGNFDKSVKEKPDFVIYNNRMKILHVSAVKLADFFRRNITYLLKRNSSIEAIEVLIYVNGVYVHFDEVMLKGLLKEMIRRYNPMLYNKKIVKDAYEDIITDLNYVFADEFDNDETIINFRDCLLKIKVDENGKHYYETMEHTPKVLSTIQLPCNYKEEPSDTKVFDKFIKDLSNDKEGISKLLLEVMGVVISNVKGYRFKKGIFLCSEGNAGKSQYLVLMQKIIGKMNFAVVTLKSLDERFGSADIRFKRLIGNADASYTTVKELNMFKQLTGGDEVRYEIKGQMASSIKFNGVIVMLMNKLILFGGDRGPHVYDRIIPIPCCDSIPKENRIKDLAEKMYKERSGIIRKALNALLTVIDNNYEYSIPKEVEEYKEKYIQSNSPYVTFFETFMEKTDKNTDKSTTSNIFKVLKEYCKEKNYYVGTFSDFKTEIIDYMYIKKYVQSKRDALIHTANGTCFNGFKLTSRAKELYKMSYEPYLIEKTDIDDDNATKLFDDKEE